MIIKNTKDDTAFDEIFYTVLSPLPPIVTVWEQNLKYHP